MKQFSILLVSLFALFASAAQAQTTDPVRQKLDLIFANVDKSQVPTGRLVEAAVPLAPITSFDGLALRDSLRPNLDLFRHLYATALSGRLYGTDTLPSLPVFNQRVRAYAPATAAGAIPVAIQCLSYARLRPDAESAGLVRIQNEQLFDVAGRTQSPYQTAYLFAAAPERTYSASKTVSLLLRRNLYLAAGAPSANPTPYLDFGDGLGYRPVTWGQPLTTNYSTSGVKRVKVKLTYSAADSRESWFDLTVFATVTPVAYRGTTTGTANATAADLEIPIAPTAIYLPYRADYTDHLGGKMSIVYGQGHTSVVKPFIVVEGYNTARIAPHLVGENNKNNDIESFLISIDIRFSSGISYKDALYQAGYDIVYIDFTEGTDDIRRNAALFEEVVRRVNTMKAQAGSTEPNVVMGESMGGLVARYGLARLVRGGYNPQTRLLMLHDSPQRGANNPMGLQALTRQADFPLAILFGNTNAMLRTSDVSDQLKEALAILDAPATKQLSLKSVTGINYEYEDNSFIDGPYRTMVDFGPSGGAPAAFPVIVATSDGSQCGRSQNTPAYQELTRNTRDYIIGLSYLVRLGVQSEAIANALPAYGTQNTIAHLRLWFTLRVLWLKSNITLLERNYTSPPNTLPYETLPGGTTNLSEQSDLVSNYSRNFIGFWRFANNTSIYNGDVCFVPTYSALDVVSVSPATAYAKYINNITDNVNPPRVARYIAQESVNSAGTQFNQAHIRFTARNSEWIFSQMQSIVPVCTPADQECSPLQLAISGGPLVCAGTGTSFTLSGQPAGASVSWSVSPAGSTVPATGTGATFTTTASTTTGVSGTVTATVTVGCGTYTPSKAIAIGKPRPVAVKTSATGEPTTYLFTAPSLPGVTYQWYRGTTLIDGETTSELSYYFPCNTSVTISYGFANDCAPGSRSAGLTKTGECIRTGTALTATLAPNPAREGVDVHIEHADPAQPLTVRLFDSYGQLRAEQTATNQKLLHLRTDKLPAGLYFVQLLQGQQVLQRLPLQVDK